MIKGRAGIAEGDDDETVARRLDETLDTYVPDPGDRAWMRPRLAAVLGEGEAPGDRAELDAAVRAFFEAVSDHGTAVLVFEDLHWADSALIDFVEDLTDWWRDRPILIVTMARPDLLELKPSWGAGRQGVVSITLGPMSSEEMLAMVHGAVPGIPQTSAEAIVERGSRHPPLCGGAVERPACSRPTGGRSRGLSGGWRPDAAGYPGIPPGRHRRSSRPARCRR